MVYIDTNKAAPLQRHNDVVRKFIVFNFVLKYSVGAFSKHVVLFSKLAQI